MNTNTHSAQPHAAIYLRIAAIDQTTTHSFDTQREKLLARASATGYTVLPEHVFIDTGASGLTIDRPALSNLRELVKSGAVQSVFIPSVDHVARRYRDAALVYAEFKRHNCLLHFGLTEVSR